MNEDINSNPKSAHDLVEVMVGGEGVATFDFEWSGHMRTPETVTFPDGTVREVGYMRDGMIDFKDGKKGTYERIVDDSTQPNQKIKISFNPTK